jgi:hypothetical protein
MRRLSSRRMKRSLCMGNFIDWAIRSPTVIGKITFTEVEESCSSGYLCALRRRLDLRMFNIVLE